MNRRQVNTRLAWQSGLASELMRLEDNLVNLYDLVGISTNNRILEKVDSEEDGLIKFGLEETDFELFVNDYLLSINTAASTICSMISEQTEFDLPVPVNVIIRMAVKVGLLRWKDYKKRPNGSLKEYVYSLTPHLIDISSMMLQSIVGTLGTNVIPYSSFINQNLIAILEWSRVSNLSTQDESSYHSLRAKLFKRITFMLERLSLNINLKPQFLKTLVEVELIENLEELESRPTDGDKPVAMLRDEHTVCALTCLEKLVVVYMSYFEPVTENKLRGYVTRTCIEIYRDFKPSTAAIMESVAARRQLLQLLITTSNMPYATTTSEIAYNIFELARKVESDPEITALLFKAVRVGLAHRPTIVTHQDVYECFGLPMLTRSDSNSHNMENGNGEFQQAADQE